MSRNRVAAASLSSHTGSQALPVKTPQAVPPAVRPPLVAPPSTERTTFTVPVQVPDSASTIARPERGAKGPTTAEVAVDPVSGAAAVKGCSVNGRGLAALTGSASP